VENWAAKLWALKRLTGQSNWRFVGSHRLFVGPSGHHDTKSLSMLNLEIFRPEVEREILALPGWVS
jgi:hypothetical protein